jgi:hypothetical protein
MDVHTVRKCIEDSILSTSLSMNQMRPELDNVLQCLSLNGYSVFSLINDILAHPNLEDQRVKLLRDGIGHDASEICSCLLRYINFCPERVLEFGGAQCACSNSSAGFSMRTELG